MTTFKNLDVSTLTPAQAVDMLGNLKAFISDLTKQEEALKARLISTGALEIDGDQFRCTVSQTDRVSLDTAKLREVLPDFIVKECEKVTTVTMVRVSARKRAA